ncbi:hypothetical protein D3C87_1508080 [compost metagenome]
MAFGAGHFGELIRVLDECQQGYAYRDGVQHSGVAIGRGELLGGFAQLGLRHVGIEVLDPGFKRRFF